MREGSCRKLETLRVPQKAPREKLKHSNTARGHRSETPGGNWGGLALLPGPAWPAPAPEACVFVSHPHPLPEPLMPVWELWRVEGRRGDLLSAPGPESASSTPVPRKRPFPAVPHPSLAGAMVIPREPSGCSGPSRVPPPQYPDPSAPGHGHSPCPPPSTAQH